LGMRVDGQQDRIGGHTIVETVDQPLEESHTPQRIEDTRLCHAGEFTKPDRLAPKLPSQRSPHQWVL
jgi:hypothetical protein